MTPIIVRYPDSTDDDPYEVLDSHDPLLRAPIAGDVIRDTKGDWRITDVVFELGPADDRTVQGLVLHVEPADLP